MVNRAGIFDSEFAGHVGQTIELATPSSSKVEETKMTPLCDVCCAKRWENLDRWEFPLRFDPTRVRRLHGSLQSPVIHADMPF